MRFLSLATVVLGCGLAAPAMAGTAALPPQPAQAPLPAKSPSVVSAVGVGTGEMLSALADRVAVNAFSLSYNNASAQLAKTIADFTQGAGKSYTNALLITGNIGAIKATHLIQAASVAGPAVETKITGKDIAPAELRVQVPVNVSYSYPNTQSCSTTTYLVSLTVVNQGTKAVPDYKVAQFIATPAAEQIQTGPNAGTCGDPAPAG